MVNPCRDQSELVSDPYHQELAHLTDRIQNGGTEVVNAKVRGGAG